MCTRRTYTIQTFSVIMVILNFHAYEAVRFLYQPTDHSAVEGKQTHVTCIFTDITDMEGKYDVIWTKDSYIISEPSNGFDLDRFSFHNIYASSRHFIRIDPVRREDAGGYRCHFSLYGDILLSSNICTLTIRKIPSAEYPLIVVGKPTYKTGDEVTITCFCEKTNPMAKLEWLRPSKNGVLGLTNKTRENNTHVWIEVTVPANLNLNGVYFECRIKVRDEIAPRYKSSERLHIIDGSELFKTTSKKPPRQTQQQIVTSSLSTDNVLSASKAENNEASYKGILWIIAACLLIVLIPFSILPTLIYSEFNENNHEID